jgi:hypothetical protein
MIRNIKDVHQEISEEAASIANASAHDSGLLPWGVQNPFDPAYRKLGLIINGFITDVELVTQLREIGEDSLKEALTQRADLTVGLILGSARRGNSYFNGKY